MVVELAMNRPHIFLCTADGEEFEPDALDAKTEIVSLDAGAVVRICREHGAPIAAVEQSSRSDA
ncbi:MAG TPA: hypothetical protein VFA78_05625 [Chloroflexota bacterium]|nr:hypothetical protein [Chloroflexota bacterium]